MLLSRESKEHSEKRTEVKAKADAGAGKRTAAE